MSTPGDHATYLGDGVYVDFDNDDVVLKANDFQNPTDQIFLEPTVLQAFLRWLKVVGVTEKCLKLDERYERKA